MKLQLKHPILAGIALIAFAGLLKAQVTVKQAGTPEAAVKELAADDVKVRNARFQGNPQALGIFDNSSTDKIFEKGLILSTGKAADLAGSNENPKTSTYNATGGDKTLYSIAGTRTFDYANLEFDFMTAEDSMSFSFIFASEEYNEFVGSTFNDAFDILVTGPGLQAGKHLGLIPNTNLPIHINSVNITKNSQFYQDNNPFTLTGKINEEAKAKLDPELLANVSFDGMTRRITVGMQVQPKTVYHMKIAIADAGDGNNDSALLLEGGGLKSHEQYKHVLRRMQIAEQRRQDSLARVQVIADSLEAIRLAEIKANEEKMKALEEMETGNEGQEEEEAAESTEEEQDQMEEEVAPEPVFNMTLSDEVMEVIVFSPGAYLLGEEIEEKLHQWGAKMAKDPKLKLGIFLTDDASEEVLKMRYDFIRLELVKGGAMTTQIFKNGFSFLKAGDEKPAQRAEIWLRKAD